MPIHDIITIRGQGGLKVFYDITTGKRSQGLAELTNVAIGAQIAQAGPYGYEPMPQVNLAVSVTKSGAPVYFSFSASGSKALLLPIPTPVPDIVLTHRLAGWSVAEAASKTTEHNLPLPVDLSGGGKVVASVGSSGDPIQAVISGLPPGKHTVVAPVSGVVWKVVRADRDMNVPIGVYMMYGSPMRELLLVDLAGVDFLTDEGRQVSVGTPLFTYQSKGTAFDGGPSPARMFTKRPTGQAMMFFDTPTKQEAGEERLYFWVERPCATEEPPSLLTDSEGRVIYLRAP